jgi:hypothetical protein
MLDPKDRDAASSPRHPREGWEESFRRMVEAGDDAPLLPDFGLTTWEDEEWEW